MERRLFEFLSALASKTKSVEEKIAMAREDSGEGLFKRIAESSDELQHQKDEFLKFVETVNARAKERWEIVSKSGNQKIEMFSTGPEAGEKGNIHELSLDYAERQYNSSVEFAACCIEWASVALSEVENATLESFAARQRLDILKAHLNN